MDTGKRNCQHFYTLAAAETWVKKVKWKQGVMRLQQVQGCILRNTIFWGWCTAKKCSFSNRKCGRLGRHGMICWVLAMEMLQGIWKQHLRPLAVVGYSVKIFLPSPPNYVTRSPGSWHRWKWKGEKFAFFNFLICISISTNLFLDSWHAVAIAAVLRQNQKCTMDYSSCKKLIDVLVLNFKTMSLAPVKVIKKDFCIA